MQNKQTKFALLEGNEITKTSFLTKPIPQTLNSGVQLGNGNCKAVILRLNRYVRNATDGTEIVCEQIYYGDSSRQEIELERGTYSQTIFCTDLSQVYIRNPDIATVEIQAIIYE